MLFSKRYRNDNKFILLENKNSRNHFFKTNHLPYDVFSRRIICRMIGEKNRLPYLYVDAKYINKILIPAVEKESSTFQNHLESHFFDLGRKSREPVLLSPPITNRVLLTKWLSMTDSRKKKFPFQLMPWNWRYFV